ncbi:GntR family transcriptional regulator [Streptomyces sp. NBC_00264]|uniref:GntR family transcriptional regulator n=1 Tax=unclassified Streptomyces TaxID=2593676 RepID=UPI00225AB6AB|nr:MULTISPECIES: GntR family transcriptional regulator [unclassified Streptomyces]MCX5166207.1 GntR family transcriptional regulator [Streptomyces sp. NBC_00305]MCX5224724.1 GntR family transcriptional regulator [Streptomyces sp. NBC_00264]
MPPKWQRLADELAQQIADGVYAPGDYLPHIRELVAQGKGSITTVHAAYKALEAEGLVVSSRGHGTRVQPQDAAPQSAVSGLGRLNRLRRTGRPYGPREVSMDHIVALRSCADVELANLLGVEPYDEVVLRGRTFVRGDKATVVALSVIQLRAANAVPELLRDERMPRFWQEIYTERTGAEISADPEMRGARLASGEELRKFGIEVPPDTAVPVLVLRSVFRDEVGPIEVWEDVYRPGMWQVSSE